MNTDVARLTTEASLLRSKVARYEAALQAIVAECERQGETDYTYDIARTARNALGTSQEETP